MIKKQCTKCGRMVNRSEFHKNKNHKDGLQSWCKECISKHHKERNASLKWESMIAFGGRCVHIDKNGVRCSKNVFADLKELDLAHPHDNGNNHRDLISNGRKGRDFYKALKGRNYDTNGYVVKVMCKSHHKGLDNKGTKHPLYGTSHSKATKNKMSIAKIGKKHPNYRDGKFNDKDWLYHEYVILEKSIRKIAKECGVSYTLIKNRTIKFNIQRRKPGRRS